MNSDEEQVVFLYAVGDAIRQWSYVENRLKHLACETMAIHSRGPVASALAAIENFRSRLAACDELIEGRYAGAAHLEEWRKIHDTLTKLSSKRNALAHRITIYYPEGEVGRRWALEEWTPEIEHRGGRPTTTALCTQQIVRIRQEFHRATSSLASYDRLTRVGVGLPPAFDAQVDDLPEIRAIRNRIRVALGLQHLPPRKKSPPNETE